MTHSYKNFGDFVGEEYFELRNSPPRKWRLALCNAIGPMEMWNDIAHTGDGESSVRDAAGNQVKLTTWDSKYLYIRDDETQTLFSPFGEPCLTQVSDRYCRIYPGKLISGSTCSGLSVEHRIFVPEHLPIELWTVTVKNNTDAPKQVSLFGYTQFNLTGTDASGKAFGRGRGPIAVVEKELGGVYCENNQPNLPVDWANGYFAALNDYKGAEGYRNFFLGDSHGYAAPTPFNSDYNCQNRNWYGCDCAATVQSVITIQPGETGRVDFVLGLSSSCAEAVEQVHAISAQDIDAWCAEKDAVETKRSEAFKLDIGNDHYNNLFNIFIKKQLYTYLINKSGFRDNLQNDAALAMVDYPAAKDNFLRALASQKISGEVPHGFRPLNTHTYSDKPAWIFLAVSQLIKESGDWTLLDEAVGYLDSDEVDSVFDHMVRTMRYLAQDTGINGLLNQHYADWNDGLQATAEAGDRESVMVSEQFCYGLRELAQMATHKGDATIAEEASRLYDDFKQRIDTVAWDGAWYQRTLCADGYRIGSDQNPYGKIFQNTQSWAVLSGVAEGDKACGVMDQVEKHLKTDIGYRICFPGFAEYDPRVGHMSTCLPGVNENGGCYNHAAGFKAVADCMLGRAEIAWETFLLVTPDNPLNPIIKSRAEPYSYINSFSSCEHIYGDSGYAWRTGTAAWFTILLVEYILGARRNYDGLLIDPCLTKTIPHAKLTRTFRGARYHISLDNTAGRCVGTTSITVDGEKIEGQTLPVFDGGEHQVDVVI